VEGVFNKYACCLQSGQSHAGRRRCKEERKRQHPALRPAAEAHGKWIDWPPPSTHNEVVVELTGAPANQPQ